MVANPVRSGQSQNHMLARSGRRARRFASLVTGSCLTVRGPTGNVTCSAFFVRIHAHGNQRRRNRRPILQEEGVDFVFGYPGGAVLYIYDELFKQNRVKHILVRHEQAAVHAADGFARATGGSESPWSRPGPG